jgi:membrane-bound ClpP family serine protease
LLILVLFAISALLLRSRRRGYVQGPEGLVGQIAVTVEPTAMQGRVFVNGEYWKASSKSGMLPKDTQVKVMAVRGDMVLEVSDAPEDLK